MRELIANYGAWVVSATTIIAAIAIGSKVKSAWLIGLGSQAAWLLYIWATAQWGLVPSWAALCVVYAFNHVQWQKLEDDGHGNEDRELMMGWVVSDAQGTKFRAWEWGPVWTDNPRAALMFARYRDAEEFCQDDEDAWKILRCAYPLDAAEREHRRSWSSLHPEPSMRSLINAHQESEDELTRLSARLSRAPLASLTQEAELEWTRAARNWERTRAALYARTGAEG